MPLLNREKIRQQKEKEARKKREQQRQQITEREKKGSGIYRKELKPKSDVVVTKTRRGEKEKQRETGSFLNKAILIVLALLVLVMLAVFFL